MRLPISQAHRNGSECSTTINAFEPCNGARMIEVFSGPGFARLGMQWHRALTLEGALSVFLWPGACSACDSGDSFREPVIVQVVAASWNLGSHILSDFLSTFPFQELDQVALASHQRRSCAAPCRQSLANRGGCIEGFLGCINIQCIPIHAGCIGMYPNHWRMY